VDDAGARPETLTALVLGRGVASSCALPERGTVVVGRSSSCDIHVPDESISRRHVALHVGERLEVEDLGSRNGTTVRGRLLNAGERSAIHPEEVIDLGELRLIVMRQNLDVERQHFWSHGHFEERLAQTCAEAAAPTSFSVARVHCDPSASEAAVEQALLRSLRPGDVAAAYAPRELEALLMGMSREDADSWAAAFANTLGNTVRVGVASFPIDGRSPEQLIAESGAALASGESGRVRAVAVEGATGGYLELVDRVSDADISVLLLGETGVGKEITAERIHRASARSSRPFLRLNCAAFSETLLENELFGHEPEAFSGASRAKPGLLETARGGTVLLDEIGELPMSLQVKLLRVLEDAHVLRVGGLKPTPIDVRFVAATNRDLEAAIAGGTFRSDLYFRLDGVTIHIPPLRERVDEIPGLAAVFAAEAAKRFGRSPVPRLSSDALELLRSYRWPGNIRELRNVVERAVLLCDGDTIGPRHLPLEKFAAAPPPAVDEVTGDCAPVGDTGRVPRATIGPGLREAQQQLAEADKQRIVDALERCGGNQTKAAKLLGISRTTLLSRLDAYSLPRPRKSSR
jgi:DNA-binding NtrC family response regulator